MKRAKESGFSLIELLVATALLLVILGPLLSFMKSAQLLRSTSYKLTDVEQNARAALVLIGRDLQNAGYNFTPSIDTAGSNLLTPLLGTGTLAVNNLYPIIPGNNVNLVETVSSAGGIVTNATDQITMVYTNQIFNNGLPLTGTVNSTGSQFTLIPGLSLTGQATLYTGDFCVLSAGQETAIGVVTSITGTNRINFQSGGADIYNINRPGVGPLSKLDPQQVNRLITLYTFYFVTYFVDRNGNLVRRERLAPPHTASLSPSNMTAASVTSVTSKYDCGTGNDCYHDNIIATGIEDLQFTYLLSERKNPNTNAALTTSPVNDPGFYGSGTNQGIQGTDYRLLDIRRVNVSIKARAQERDTKVRDPYNSSNGYLYRFSLEGTFNTRNFYGNSYKPKPLE